MRRGQNEEPNGMIPMMTISGSGHAGRETNQGSTFARSRDNSRQVYPTNGDAGLSAKNSTDNSRLFTLLKPIIQTLTYLGAWPKDGPHIQLRFTFWSAFVCVLLHFYSIHLILNWFTVIKHTSGIFQVFEQLTSIMRTVIVAITFDIRFARQPNLKKLLNDIEAYPEFTTEYRLTNLTKWIRIVVGVSLFFIVLQFSLGAGLAYRKNPTDYVNWLVYGNEGQGGLGPVAIRFIMTIDWALCLTLVNGNEMFTFSLYISLISILRHKMRDYNSLLEQASEGGLVQQASQVQELYRYHSRLTSLSAELEDTMGLTSLFWIVGIIFSICVKAESIVSGLRSEAYDEFYYVVTDTIYYGLVFLTICFTASELSEENSAPVVAVTKMAEQAELNDWNYHQEVQLLLTKLNTPMMRLTGWSCFVINKSFMLTVMGALATYIIVIIQM